jgi:uncharacterized cupredoxin-like copper-binding protein
MRKLVFILCVVFVMIFALSACGGTPAASTNLKVNMIEFTFTPSEFTVPAGKEITITAVNGGAVEHEFVIFKLGQTPGDKVDDADQPNIYWQMKVAPGESTTTTFTAPAEAGEYYVTCGTPGHHQAGMNGKLIVVADK